MRAMRLPIFLAILLVASAYAVSLTHADTTCPNAGERPATAADVEYMKNNGFPADYQQVGRCWNPNDKNVGIDVAKAKEDLAAVRCGTGVNVAQLDPKFSGCADKFMQALRQLSPSACITSAYRDQQQQAAACRSICGQLSCPGLCAAPGKSYHQQGLAIDLSKVTISKQQFWQLALQSGIGNPTGLHNSDPYHIQSMNGGISCATAGYLPTDNDTFTPGPMSSNPYFGYGQNPLPSMQPLTAAPSVSMTPTQTATPSTGTTNTGTSQPQICNPSYSCSAGTMYYQTTSCTTQVYQLCVYGCDGNACKTASSTSSTLNGVTGAFSSSSTSTSDSTNTNTNTNDNTNISDILNSLSIGDMYTSTEVGTSVPLSLNASINQIGLLQSGTTSYPTGTLVASGTIQSYQPVGSQSTFVTQDLASIPGAVVAQNSAVFSILQGMKNALLGALNFLLSLGR
ncbi:MAG TPA: D-alanyl-D-alanine carboxypeptidase family protein [Candidatus Paceibacterota bacterium]|nr:D-alanyl-D-alanine carboxypeptidase family protein [Candidatus Paceibacterota bacterium]